MKIIININDRFAKFVKKMCTTRNMVFTVAMVLFCAGLFVFSESVNIPNQLHEGDIIVAEELNQNFQALRDRDLDSLTDVDTSGAEDGQYLKYVTGTWVASDGDPVTGDNLGNHIAESNLNMNGYYLSGDGGSEGVFVDTDGNVGIGTISPGVTLDVCSGVADFWVACFRPDASSRGILLGERFGCAAIGANEIGGNANLVIAPDLGNVGIKNTNPNYTLDVTGDINYTGTLRQNGTPVSFTGGQWTDQGSYINANNATNVVVTDTGNVGIGTTSPDHKLHINVGGYGLIRLDYDIGGGSGMTMYENGTRRASLVYDNAIDTDEWKFYAGGSNPSDLKMVIENTGNVGIGTTSPNYRLQVGEISNYGWVNADGTWGSSSDVRQKENIKDMSSGLDKILAIRSVSYNTIGSDPEKEDQIGFIAQEVEEIVPEIVSTDQEGYKGIAYAKLTPILVKAIQEQQELIEELKAEIAELSLRLDDL